MSSPSPKGDPLTLEETIRFYAKIKQESSGTKMCLDCGGSVDNNNECRVCGAITEESAKE